METLSLSIQELTSLPLKLTPFSARELFFLKEAPCDIFCEKGGTFFKLIDSGTPINLNLIKKILDQRIVKLFSFGTDRPKIVSELQGELQRVSRGLSIGDPFSNGKKLLNLLSMNLGQIYTHPTDDETFMLQVQCVKNFSEFMSKDLEVASRLYKEYLTQKYHFIYAQPLVATLLLSTFLQYGRFFSEREKEALILTSYFKDVGMSTIAPDKLTKQSLSPEEKLEILGHSEQSIRLLQGRLPVGPSYFEIIRNHHTYGLLNEEMIEDNDLITGIETLLIISLDIVGAMTSHRPYREAVPLFNTLDYVKKLIGDHYPQEFKLMVQFFKKFMVQS